MSAGATEAVEIVLTTGDRVGVGAGASVDVVRTVVGATGFEPATPAPKASPG